MLLDLAQIILYLCIGWFLYRCANRHAYSVQ